MSRVLPRHIEEGLLAEDLSLGDGATYLREIRQHELLSAEQEISLARQLGEGKAAQRELEAADQSLDSHRKAELEQKIQDGENARRHLIECNLRLVVYIARQYVGRGLSLLDLIQEGNIGLHLGVDKYDWQRGFRLSTYAYWWIRQAITRSLAEQSRTIRLPLHVVELLGRVTHAEREIQATGAVPTVEAVAQMLGTDAERICEIQLAAQMPLSIEANIAVDPDRIWGDLLRDEAADAVAQRELESEEVSNMIAEALQLLNPRERKILQLRFGLGCGEEQSVTGIARLLAVSPKRVRQIEKVALAKLRRSPRFQNDVLAYLAA